MVQAETATGKKTAEGILSEVRRAVRTADPIAFLVEARVVRRVIREEHDLTRFGVTVPHAESCVAERGRMRGLVHPDELGLEREADIPERVILLAEPGEKEITSTSAQELLLRTWRQLFHARIDFELAGSVRSGSLTVVDIRRRIDEIGQVAFDEIHSVLHRERRLLNEDDRAAAFLEFVATYCEFRWFARPSLATWFPSLDDYGRIDDVVDTLVDPDALANSCRLYGAPDPVRAESGLFDEFPQDVREGDELVSADEPNARRFRRFMRKADKAGQRGNSVSAALNALRAAQWAPEDDVSSASTKAFDEIHRLTSRLQVALDFDDEEAEDWRSALIGLLKRSGTGFWNPDKKLLYDLQKVCVDHEREIYTVDLVKWIVSLGKRPIKRPLPNQREVMMSKHLASAAARVTQVRLSGHDRERLAVLLRRAADSAERQMRLRLRPLVVATLEQVQLEPHNIPEEVAFNKLIDESLDCIAVRGYLTMGYLRDAISRNNLKLPDVTRIGELIRGDRLLRADDRFDVALDGVYHRGEFYLRWLQLLSSLAFGTRVGRFFTQYVGIPFGGAFLGLEGLRHIIDLLTRHRYDTHLVVSPFTVLLVGGFVLGLIHAEPFRDAVMRALRMLFRGLRRVFYDWPVAFFRLQWVRSLLRSAPAVVLRRYVLVPGLLTGLVSVARARLFDAAFPSVEWQVLIFVLFSAGLNSRFVRDAEELTLEWFSNRWHEIHARVFVALFEWILESFKRLLNLLERVLYAVDEWLRFKSGETVVTLAVKAVLGVAWSLVDFLVRIYVTLLIEPQVNPIKHFPVVTVSHKIILPITFWVQTEFGETFTPFVGTVISNFVVGTTMFLLPGVFGFLVWELKENWRLYESNRPRRLPPTIVGSHGETLPRVLRPGFHSGTLPKLFRKLRRLESITNPFRRFRRRRALYQQQHHLQVDLRRFVERELVALLRATPRWQRGAISVISVQAASNSVVMTLECESFPDERLELAFQEQSGWLLASVPERGWLDRVDRGEQDTFATALIGCYRFGAVDLVREQIESSFGDNVPRYDVTHSGLTVWPGGAFDVEITYDLHRDGAIRPWPYMPASQANLGPIEARDVRFSLAPITWEEWVRIWDTGAESTVPLPEAQSVTAAIASA